MLKWKIIVEEPLLFIQDEADDIEVFHLMCCHNYPLSETIKLSIHQITWMPRPCFLIIPYGHPPGILQPWGFPRTIALKAEEGCAVNIRVLDVSEAIKMLGFPNGLAK